MVQDLSGRYSPPDQPYVLLTPTSQNEGSAVQDNLSAAAMTAPGSPPAFKQPDYRVILDPTAHESGAQDSTTYDNTLPFGRHVPPPPDKAMPGSGTPPEPFAQRLPAVEPGPHWGRPREDGH